MRNVLIRNVPDDVHAELQRRAEASGQSLQQFLSDELARVAHRPTLGEVLTRIERRRGGRIGFAGAIDDLRSERGRS